MRRPVKPFVTEYKGPNRRPGQPATPGHRLPNEEFSFSPPAGDGFPRPPSDGPSRHAETGASRNTDNGASRSSESSYEAALRAADALFSPAAKAAPPSPSEETDPHDGSLFKGEGGDAGDPRGSRRILRAIDEPVPVEAVEVEEPALEEPKRRGRKPGSKNKPKSQPESDATGNLSRFTPAQLSAAQALAAEFSPQPVPSQARSYEIASSPAGSMRTPIGQAASRQDASDQDPNSTELPTHVSPAQFDYGSATDDTDDTDDFEDDGDEVSGDLDDNGDLDDSGDLDDNGDLDDDEIIEAVASPVLAAKPRVRVTSRPTEKFSWVRTKLAPGEQWKRRLPKVCW